MALSYAQQGVLNALRKRGPGWYDCRGVAGPTVDGLERQGLVVVRSLPDVMVTRERCWYAVDTDNPDAPAPEMSPMRLVAAEVAQAWNATGWCVWLPPQGFPSEAARKVAALHFRAAADLLDPRS